MRISSKLLSAACLIVVPLCSIADEALPIGQLQTAEHWIVIHSAPDGLVYTVKTHDGVLVDDQLTEQRFVALYPELSETLRNAIARPQLRRTPEMPTDKSD